MLPILHHWCYAARCGKMAGTFIYLRDKDLKLAQDLHIDPKDMVRMLFNAVREHPELRNEILKATP